MLGGCCVGPNEVKGALKGCETHGGLHAIHFDLVRFNAECEDGYVVKGVGDA